MVCARVLRRRRRRRRFDGGDACVEYTLLDVAFDFFGGVEVKVARVQLVLGFSTGESTWKLHLWKRGT